MVIYTAVSHTNVACVPVSHPRDVIGDIYVEETVTAQGGSLANVMLSNSLMSFLHAILTEDILFLHYILSEPHSYMMSAQAGSLEPPI